MFPTLALALGLAFAASADAALTYSVSSDLKKGGCAGDVDNDCLDNTEENNLAWAAAPWYFYDEAEDCSAWQNRFGVSSNHFARQDFFQLRPGALNVQGWSPTDGQAKWVRITYFFLYPHDCKNLFEFGGGHQGDPEQVMLDLYSYDLRTWYLAGAAYPAHGHTPVPYMSGAWLESRAQQLGTSWISVTADEDSHGSWMGREVTSSHCAGSEDDYCGSTCDCFENTWQWDFNNGYVEAISANRNIGGPTPETWNASVLTVSGGDAYSQLDVGHGLNREYWTPRSDQYKKNCGWECPAANRQSDGNCSLTIHDRSGCSSHLSEKVDRTNSCFEPGVNHCGGAGVGSGCYCDASCTTYGDCCADACSICGVCSAPLGLASAPAAPFAAASRPAPATEAGIPWLSGPASQERLRVLKWMLTVSDDRRLVSLFDDLRGPQKLELKERAAMARQRLEGMAAGLERAGHRAPEAARGLALDRFEENAPPPNYFPPSLIKELENLPDDPEAARMLEEARRVSPPGNRPPDR